MDSLTLDHPFQNIPRKKLEDAIAYLNENFSNNGVLTTSGAHLVDAFHRYWISNIPVDYWYRDMFNFEGDKSLLKRYAEITRDIPKSFRDGVRVCFAGAHGVGKSMTCACILKRVVEHSQYEALYVNLTDVIRVLTGPNSDDKTNAHSKLLEVDFLVIDEVDQRFMGTENAADLFGRVLEPVMRTRIQNRMPLLFCTNSPRVEDSFTGSLKASIDSLMKVVQLHPVMSSKDFRATIGRNKK